MILPYKINGTTEGRLRLIDQAGSLTAIMSVNSNKKTKSLNVKTEDIDDGKIEEYTAMALSFEKDLFNGCYNTPITFDIKLKSAINKYCSIKTRTAIKAEIVKGVQQEIAALVVGL